MVAEPRFDSWRENSDTAQEFEYRARLEKQREAQKALESELLEKMESLKGVHGSWTRMLLCRSATNTTGIWNDHQSLLHDQGCRLQIVSILAVKGGKVPVDAGSLVTSCEYDKRFEESGNTAALENTQTLDQVKIQVMIEDIDCPFYASGHCIFVVFEERCVDVVTGLVGAKDSAGPLVRRQKVAGFSDDVEKIVGLYGKVPKVLETKFEELGVKFVEGETFQRHAVRDERLVTGENPMSSVTCLRERRLQDESSKILIDVTFATDVESHFESSISETFNFTVKVAVTVTADDDNDHITVLPVVEEHVYTICRLGVGRRLGSSVACPRGAGRRLRRRITCRCGADWRMSPRVTCPSTKSCTAGTDSRVHALLRPRCLWQVTRSVGGNAEDRAEDLREDADGGPSCGWRPTGASAAEVDPLQAQSIVEESVDCVTGAVLAGCYDKEWFHEADFSVPLDQACKGTSTRRSPQIPRGESLLQMDV